MTHVVTDSCIACKYTDCVEVCPVDCFHEGTNFLVINPHECIDCALCVSECPVNAIKPEGELTQDDLKFVALNAELSLKWPVINIKKEALKEAEQMAKVNGKLDLLKK